MVLDSHNNQHYLPGGLLTIYYPIKSLEFLIKLVTESAKPSAPWSVSYSAEASNIGGKNFQTPSD